MGLCSLTTSPAEWLWLRGTLLPMQCSWWCPYWAYWTWCYLLALGASGYRALLTLLICRHVGSQPNLANCFTLLTAATYSCQPTFWTFLEGTSSTLSWRSLWNSKLCEVSWSAETIGGRNKPTMSVCQVCVEVCESTHVKPSVASRREKTLRNANSDRYRPPTRRLKKKVWSWATDFCFFFPMIELSRLAVMWLWSYFHERVGSVYAYTRAAHMKRGACLPIRNITILMHFPRFGFNVTLVYQHESVRNVEAQCADPSVS